MASPTTYIIKGKQHFVTTDSPIVEKWLPPAGFYGASFLKRDKYFALTPKILLGLTYPVGSIKIKRKTIYGDENSQINMFNVILVSGAQEYAYSGNRSELEKLLECRKRPGSLELTYFHKYVKPWAEWKRKMGITK